MPDLADIRTEEDLLRTLSTPYPEDVDLAGRIEGDVIVLGAGGKMGPTLVCRMASAFAEAGASNRIFAASRYSDESSRRRIEDAGAEAISVDLLDEAGLRTLPDCPNVIYLVGMKFGATDRLPLTWALNAYLPGRVATRYRTSRIVALSTGNVYPPVPVTSGGASEETEPRPVGEYAQSCLGRERIFQHVALRYGTPTCLVRLNYAVEARYGVLLDVAQKVAARLPVPLETGHVNTIWQGDANSAVFRALEVCAAPATVLNVTGREILSIRELAERFGRRLGVPVRFEGTEAPTALLNDASRCHARFGLPRVATDDIVALVASWVERGGATHGKPTKYEVRSGEF